MNTLADNLDKLVAKDKIAGYELLLTRGGETTLHTTAGLMDREAGIEWPPNSLCRIGSMTKAITAAVTMILIERGLLGLHDSLSDHLPLFADMDVAILDERTEGEARISGTEKAACPITILDLLRHTSGLVDHSSTSPLANLYAKAGITDWQGSSSAFLDTLASLPLNMHPGTGWHYSHSSNVLGLLIEKMTGQRLDRAFQELLFDPLGMEDTHFVAPRDKLARLPNIYRYDGGRLVLTERAETSRFGRVPPTFSAGGGFDTDEGYGSLLSTAADFSRFLQMLLNGGRLDGLQILSPESAHTMQRNQTAGLLTPGLPTGCGFNMFATCLEDPEAYPGQGRRGQYWWAGSCNTFYFVDPEESLAAILMTQTLPWPVHRLMVRFRNWCIADYDQAG